MKFFNAFFANIKKRSAVNRAYMQAVMLLERTPSDKSVTINVKDGDFSISYSSSPKK